MGTPDFAIPSLKMLIENKYNVVAVITQSDKPKGRGKKICEPPVKQYARSINLEVLQPTKLKEEEFVKSIIDLKPELFITVAYGKILPKVILDIPPLGCINVHGSLLPKYRGASPINRCIMNGDKYTGITTMFTDLDMDTGDMILNEKVEIHDEMTAGQLHDIMSEVGAKVLKETLVLLEQGNVTRTPQKHEEATYAPLMKKNDGKIDWNKSCEEIINIIRGTNPWPAAFTCYQGDRMKIWHGEKAIETFEDKKPGTICKVDSEGITVACGEGFLIIREVQFDSCRKMCVNDYICGHIIVEGEILE